MLAIELHTALRYQVLVPSHCCFNLQVMAHPRHRAVQETLRVEQPGQPLPERRDFTDAQGNRFLRFDTQPGELQLDYRCRLELAPAEGTADAPGDLAPQHLVTDLPSDVLGHLMPSRYCESDMMARAAMQLFGHLPPDQARVRAIVDWIRTHVQYQVGSTTGMTSARQVFVQRVGVCRDFAHLAITFCRALNVPARLVVGYVYFDEPPQDFHAVFEAWLGGRWVLFDPTGLADPARLVRVGQGSDAKDVAFLTAFGALRMEAMRIDLQEHHLPSGQRRGSQPHEPPVLGLVQNAPGSA